jgi:DNA (cytosine-5)-methyltransferase 1
MDNLPKIIDLFAGVGGLTLGAARAGFSVSAVVEKDRYAFETHAQNFPHSIHSNADVGELSGKSLLSIANLQTGELDGLIGGPPCQGFSVMGLRKPEDVRNHLFLHFFRLVAETKPRFFIAENVPGILHSKYSELIELALKSVPPNYSIIKPLVVKANLYGAPTSRTRIFFIGYDPSRFSKALSADDFKPKQQTQLVYVANALQGLPEYINPSWQTEESSWHKISPIIGSYFGDLLINSIPDGVGNPNAIKRLHEKNEISGFLGTVHSLTVAERYAQLKPGQQDAISKAVRLDAKGFCPTIRAGTASDKGSYQAVRPIHHTQARVITPREAARLQGFPDWFTFHPTKWHSFRQIGNSVSPIVSEAILKVLRDHL